MTDRLVPLVERYDVERYNRDGWDTVQVVSRVEDESSSSNTPPLDRMVQGSVRPGKKEWGVTVKELVSSLRGLRGCSR